jgi:hypothetical protein
MSVVLWDRRKEHERWGQRLLQHCCREQLRYCSPAVAVEEEAESMRGLIATVRRERTCPFLPDPVARLPLLPDFPRLAASLVHRLEMLCRRRRGRHETRWCEEREVSSTRSK